VTRIRTAALLVVVCGLTACSGPRLAPALSPARPHRDALVILPGFGYGRDDGRAFRTVAATAAASGIDVYVPAYVTRGGLESSRDKLLTFVRDARLDRYERVHLFAFIAGAWTVNPLLDRGALPNLATVVYDRSPLQERAPLIAVRDLRLPAWLRYGATIFDVARTPYPPLARRDVRVALLVETEPTRFIRRHARPGDITGSFDCGGFSQRFDDCAYVPLNHDDLYTHFTDIWPDLEAFIHSGRFSPSAERTPPSREVSALGRQR
jgi:hypothetical protein